MKNFAVKVAALFCCLMVGFTAFVSIPVRADYVLDDYLDNLWWKAIQRNIEMMLMLYSEDENGNNPYRYEIYDPNNPEHNPDATKGWDNLTTGRDYYTGSEGRQPYSGYGYDVTANAYHTGNTFNAPLVENTYNTTTNNYEYVFNMPTYNNYETYNISNIYYNQTYNTYKIHTTNNYNYYINYSPTYINITYLDGSNQLVNDTHYFKLPDGRNSLELKAEDVFGEYFIYDYTNYDTVIEDENTLLLAHFDGNHKDDSAYKRTLSYSAGAAANYVEHPGFGSAIYWDAQDHKLNLPASGGTTEFMLFCSQAANCPQFVPKVPHLLSEKFYTESARGEFSAVGLMPDGYETFKLVDGQETFTEDTYQKKWQSMDVYGYCHPVGYVVSIGGTGYIPVYEYGELTIRKSASWWKSSNYGQYSLDIQGQNNLKYALCRKDGKDTEGNDKYIPIPVGQWNRWAVCGGTVYMNGLPVEMETIEGDGNSLYMPGVWGNYWNVDELRVSQSALYSGSYTPLAHPFDTNKVLVLPENGKNGEIAVKSNVPVATLRVGGVRPSAPAIGDVYVAIEKTAEEHKVSTAQQYQTGGWVGVDAAIYKNDKWETLKGYDMRSYTTDEDDVPTPPPDDSGSTSGSTSTPGGDGGDDDDGESFWDFLLDLLKGLLALVGTLVTSLVSLLGSLFDALTSLVGFTTNFGGFIGEAFAFIPAEITGVITVGLTLAVILMIVRFIRG